MKQAAIRLLGSLAPDRLWNAMLQAMVQNDDLFRRHGHRYLSQIAAKMRITSVTANGRYGTFSGSPNDVVIFGEYVRTGTWAEETNRAISRFFHDGRGTYLDIGANIGLTTVPIASNSDVKCFAFEPEPNNFRNLKRNVAENCADADVSIFQLALFDRGASIKFELSTYNLGDHRIRMDGAPLAPSYLNEHERRVISVPCIRLDDLKVEIKHPLFVKIDTQGAEPFVIAGGGETLAKADRILMEWSPHLMKRMGGDPASVIAFLHSNFSSGAIHHDPDAPHNELLFRPIDEVCSELDASLKNWCASKYADITVRR